MDPPSWPAPLARARRALVSGAWARWASIGLLAGVALLLVAAATGLSPASRPSVAVSTAELEDADADGLPDAIENSILGTDPFAFGATEVPESWIRKFGLDVSDPELALREAPVPDPAATPSVYGVGGLPRAMHMSVGEVYAYERPADWDEARQGAWDSGLDPRRWDHADSGVPYAWLIAFDLDPFDVDALDRVAPDGEVAWTPREAYLRGLHPLKLDGDEDGLLDEQERAIGTDPYAFSTLRAGIADGWLVCHAFDPLDPAVPHVDTDRDGLTNVQEFDASRRLAPASTMTCAGGLDPRRPSTVDGPIPDGWLARFGLAALDPDVAGSTTDTGEDGASLTAFDEYAVNRPPGWNEAVNGPWWGGTDPTRPDTDEDGLPDVAELEGWSIRLNDETKVVRSDPTLADSDDDGLSDAAERDGVFGASSFPRTDPSNPDTDSDGLLDGIEIGAVEWPDADLPLLDPTNEDTDTDGMADGPEASHWSERADQCLSNEPYPWGPLPRLEVRAALARDGRDPDGVCASLFPGGDLDEDGLVNLRDADSDEDGLLDGAERDPDLYRATKYASDFPRPSTDPANGDTDADGLPDAWEMAEGAWDATIGGWNLDPSQWSSFRDTVSDADRDLDGDSATWYSFRPSATGGLQGVAHGFVSSNAVEHEHGSRPNVRSSSPDGIPDGWKIFWGRVYPNLTDEARGSIYPGAPGAFALPADARAPAIGVDDRFELSAFGYRRWLDERSPLLPGERAVEVEVTDTSGTKRRLRSVEAVHSFDTLAALRAGTNPYLPDTDGDGMRDAWEALWAPLGTPSARIDPVAPDAAADLDGDGAINQREEALGTDPYRADSDFGGADDGAESKLRLNPLDASDDARALDLSRDSDKDGIPDVREISGASGAPATDPLDPDTDRDGLLDGRSLSVVLARTLRSSNATDAAIVAAYEARGLLAIRSSTGTVDIVGEKDVGSDPTLASTTGDGVPDGYLVLHSLSPLEPSGLLSRYTSGRPAWWNESSHGIWRWGLGPVEPSTTDRDGDGLHDGNGEDPIPYANRANVLPLGHPLDATLPEDRLARAQAYGGDPTPEPVGPRASPTIALDPSNATLRLDGSVSICGRVRVGSVPAPNVTVVLSWGAREVVLGAAVTNASGGFCAPAAVGTQVAAPPGASGVAVFGSIDGTGTHENDPQRLAAISPASPPPVVAWTYNTSRFSGPRQAHEHALANGSRVVGLTGAFATFQPAEVRIVSAIALSGPDRARPAQAIVINATLADALGRPLAGEPLAVEPFGTIASTDADGRASIALTTPRATGVVTVNVSFAGRMASLPTRANASLVVQEETRVSVQGPPRWVHPGESFAVTGVLATADGEPLPRTLVQIAGFGGAATQTDDRGAYRAVLDVPAATDPGTSVVTVRFAGDDTRLETSASIPVTVEGAPYWTVSAGSAELGQDTSVEAVLHDASGAPMAHAPFLVQDAFGAVGRHATSAQGKARLDVASSSWRAGEHTLTLAYSDPLGGTATAFVPILVTSPVEVAFGDVHLVRGGESVVAGTVTDGRGLPLAGAPVRVDVGGVGRTVISDRQGGFLFAYVPAIEERPGIREVKASYAGTADGTYRPAVARTEATMRDGVRLVAESDVVLVSRPRVVVVARTLYDEPLPHLNVRFAPPWETLDGVTDAEGKAAFGFAVPASRALGPMPVTLESKRTALLAESATDATLSLRDEGTLSWSPPTSLLVGAGATLEARLLDSRGAEVPSATLRVTLGDAELAKGRGPRLTVHTPSGTPVGPAVLRLEGASEHVVAEPLRADLFVQRASRLTLVEATTARAGDPAEIVVRLDGAEGTLAGKPLLVTGAGPERLRVLTDEQGVARIPVPRTVDAQSIRVVFGGDEAAGSSAVVASVRTVEPPATSATGPAWWILVAIVALAAAGLVAWRLRLRSRPAAILARAARRLRRPDANLDAIYAAYVELLKVSGIDEDSGEVLTFGAILDRLGAHPRREDAEALTNVFNKAVYAPEALLPADVALAADSLKRVAEAMP